MRDDGRPVRVLAVAGFLFGALLLGACRGDPLAGPALQVVGESTKVRLGQPLPASSPFFDGREVRLRAARGEVLGVQVLRSGADAVPVALTLAVPGIAVDAFTVDHLPVVRPSTGMYGPSTGKGSYPDRLTPGEQPLTMTRAAFFDVRVGSDVAAGVHTGELRVGTGKYPVHVRVDDVVLPSIAAEPRVWAYYDPREVAHDEGVESSTDAAWEIEKRHAALFRAHGVYASPEWRVSDAERRQPLSTGVSFVPVILPRDPEPLRAAIAFFGERVRATGQRAFAIPIDEPRAPEAKQEVRALAQLVRDSGGGRDVLFAVTDTPHEIYGDLIDVYISPYAVHRERAPGRAELWTYNGSGPVAGSMILDTHGVDLRTWGWIAHRWRVPLWYVWDALYWHDRYSARRKKVARASIPISPVDRDAVTFDDGGDHGNLDGVLAFPGVRPSLRLKVLRRGQQDRVLLSLAAACHAAAVDALAAKMVPVALADAPKPPGRGAWPVDEESWETARQALLDIVAACPR
jgi:hypothetical protein